MVKSSYAKAYKEVIEIIKYLPKEEYNRIPEDKIKFFEENMDINYDFTINPEIDLSKQNISRKANAIIISLFLDYFATEKQKEKIEEVLRFNEEQHEQEKQKKYNPENLFKDFDKESIGEIHSLQDTKPIVAMEKYKENIFTKFKMFILKFLHKDNIGLK